MMTNESIKMARLWTELATIKEKLNNEIVPLGWHLGLDDQALIAALEAAAANIERHFREFKLVAETVKR